MFISAEAGRVAIEKRGAEGRQRHARWCVRQRRPASAHAAAAVYVLETFGERTPTWCGAVGGAGW